MSFENIDSFISMGGHGLYVWLSYSIGLLVFLIAFISPIIQRKRIVKELLQLQRRQETKQNMKDHNSSIN